MHFHYSMTDLVACLSSGEKSWVHVARLIKEQEWKRAFLITNDFGRKNFKAEKDVEFIVVDFQKPVFQLIKDIRKGLKGKTMGELAKDAARVTVEGLSKTGESVTKGVKGL